MSKSFDAAESEAIGNLSFSDDASSELSTRLTAAYANKADQYVACAFVKHHAPRPYWESHIDSDTELANFRASFRKYTPVGVPRNKSLRSFRAALRDNKQVKESVHFSRVLTYLDDNVYIWIITRQNVLAERDPGQLEHTPTVWSSIASAFRQRVHYKLVEYILVIDLLLTRREREKRKLHARAPIMLPQLTPNVLTPNESRVSASVSAGSSTKKHTAAVSASAVSDSSSSPSSDSVELTTSGGDGTLTFVLPRRTPPSSSSTLLASISDDASTASSTSATRRLASPQFIPVRRGNSSSKRGDSSSSQSHSKSKRK